MDTGNLWPQTARKGQDYILITVAEEDNWGVMLGLSQGRKTTQLQEMQERGTSRARGMPPWEGGLQRGRLRALGWGRPKGTNYREG